MTSTFSSVDMLFSLFCYCLGFYRTQVNATCAAPGWRPLPREAFKEPYLAHLIDVPRQRFCTKNGFVDLFFPELSTVHCTRPRAQLPLPAALSTGVTPAAADPEGAAAAARPGSEVIFATSLALETAVPASDKPLGQVQRETEKVLPHLAQLTSRVSP